VLRVIPEDDLESEGEDGSPRDENLNILSDSEYDKVNEATPVTPRAITLHPDRPLIGKHHGDES